MTDTTSAPEVKKTLPPYLSLAQLRKLVEMITDTRPKTLTSAILKKDFGPTDASIAMGTLRFLDLVDDAGNTKDSIKEFNRKGADRAPALEPIIRNAYKALFEHVADGAPQNLPAEKLHNHFLTVYDVAPRIAESAVRAFFYLAEEAGLKERTAAAPRPSAPRPKKTEVAPRRAGATNDVANRGNNSFGTDTIAIPFEGGITFALPAKVLSNADLIADYKNVLTAIKTFVSRCEQVLKDENPDQHE